MGELGLGDGVLDCMYISLQSSNIVVPFRMFVLSISIVITIFNFTDGDLVSFQFMTATGF